MAKKTTQDLFDAEKDASAQGPVECLGMSFPNDEARRAYFLEKLREKLKDPEFRQIEGFPAGSDADILAISDPPYYTACPNPFLTDFVNSMKSGTDGAEYHREPLSCDVSEARTDAIYTAHPYHTKVPPRAIAHYILHFTKPGDIVLDGFSGSGMTGVACALCGDSAVVSEYGGMKGARKAILCDLSPAATFVSSVYLLPPDPTSFSTESGSLLAQTDKELGDVWRIGNGGGVSLVDFQAWGEEFTCPLCQKSVVSERVVDPTKDIGTAKEFPCPHCHGLVSKAPSKGSNASKLERSLRNRFDPGLRKSVPFLPRKPILSQVRSGKERRTIKSTDQIRQQLEALSYECCYWHPTDELIKGERYELKDYCHAYGITHIHHFYLPRQLRTYAFMWQVAGEHEDRSIRNALRFFVQSNCLGMTIMNRYTPTHFSHVSQNFSGTLYIPSAVAETCHRYTYGGKQTRLVKAFGELRRLSTKHCITTQSSSSLRQLPDESVDYVFVDPPFGRNLQYSELNQIWEAWLRVKTNRQPEAVMDATRKRELLEYTSLMSSSFSEMYRVLKPNHWLTVVFHNSSNAVWFALQESLMHAGFVVADVQTLSREADTYKQIRQGLVKQDLVISCYKPSKELEQCVRIQNGSENGVWAFVRNHLRQVPVFAARNDRFKVIAERQSFLLFDRMVAFHVERGLAVPLSASEFFLGLTQRFPERDGMYFLSEQANEYDRKRLEVSEVEQYELFVSDEKSAIQWVRRQLAAKPTSYQDLQPVYMREAQRVWEKHEQPLELRTILDQNFVMDTDGTWRVPDPKKEADLEQIRQRALMKEFQQYLDMKGRLKVVRTEALRAGFKECWQKSDYPTIVQMARRVPDAVIQEDQALLMYYDNALMRVGE
jgi:16S rRNA G966 N2-methylase RsmD